MNSIDLFELAEGRYLLVLKTNLKTCLDSIISKVIEFSNFITNLYKIPKARKKLQLL